MRTAIPAQPWQETIEPAIQKPGGLPCLFAGLPDVADPAGKRGVNLDASAVISPAVPQEKDAARADYDLAKHPLVAEFGSHEVQCLTDANWVGEHANRHRRTLSQR